MTIWKFVQALSLGWPQRKRMERLSVVLSQVLHTDRPHGLVPLPLSTFLWQHRPIMPAPVPQSRRQLQASEAK
jgi:hypothetical protein